MNYIGNIIHKLKLNYTLLFIIILGSFLRLVYLGSVPQGLHYQESTLGWRAQNLLEFGKDEYGRKLPLVFSNWKDIELPIPIYISVPFVLIDKTDPFFLRLSFALAGIVSIYGSILLTSKIFPNKKNLPLLVGFIVAINPWGVWLSRTSSPVIFAFSFTLLGFSFLLDKTKIRYIGCLLLSLAIMSSRIAWFFIPPLILYLSFKKGFKKYYSFILAVCVVMVFLIFKNIGGTKAIIENDFPLFTDSSIVNNINFLRGQNYKFGSPLIGNIFYNKLYYLVKILENFLSHFNVSFIFAKGDNNLLNVPDNYSPLLIVFLPFFIFGLKILLEKKENLGLLFLWLIFATFPGLFLFNTPAVDRFIMALYPLSVIIALGMSRFTKKISIIFMIVVLFNLSIIINSIIVKNKNKETVFHSSTIEVAKYLENKRDKKIWLSDSIDLNPGPTIAYFLQLPYFSSNLPNIKNRIYKGWVNKLNNIDIGNIEQVLTSHQKFDFVMGRNEEVERFICLGVKEEFGIKDNNSYVVNTDCNL